MTPLMKAAIHLGQDFLENSQVYKNTKFENFFKKEHSECKDPGLSFTLMDKICAVQRQRDQLGECKSLCLCRFSSTRG